MTRAGQDLAGRLAAMSFHAPFRRYQALALEAFERARLLGDRRIYLTMPPGSGKTVVGLELARRLGRPTLVLGPNTAIQSQWLSEWSSFVPRLVDASGHPDLEAPVTALTYQAIAVLDRPDADDDADPADPGQGDAPPRPRPPRSAHERRRERLLVARGGDHEAVLGLLHENGRAIVSRLAGRGPVTLILDECHHLIELWGHVLEAVIDALGAESTIIGLTATPPRELTTRQAALHRRLFGGHADFETVTPAVVKDGYLAPYQELAYITRPTADEQRWIGLEQERFDALVIDLLDPAFASVPFGAWFAVRIMERRSPDGAPVGWPVLERDDPELARAAVRWQWSRGLPPPPGAHLREEHRRPLDATDWIALLDGYVRDTLLESPDRLDRIALDRIRRVLPSIGYRLTRHGIRRTTTVVDRVLGLSMSKAEAAVRILEAEERALGSGLRAVILCDFEAAGRSAASAARVLDRHAGSAAGALRALLGEPSTARLHPVLVTGRTVACSRATAVTLVRFARSDEAVAPLFARSDPLSTGFDALVEGSPGGSLDGGHGWEQVVLVEPGDPRWTTRVWVPLVTAFFESGGSRCLIGTRALLGEGWNSPPTNVLIDLGAATTSISVQQVRGRTLRLDPGAPDKVADNWDVVCVAEQHARGAADYERFVRKHHRYFALGFGGEIESGVSHVDPALGPFGPPPAEAFDRLTREMLGRAAARDAIREGWRIGEPYRDVPVETVRIRLGRSPGLPGTRLLRAGPRRVGGRHPAAVMGGGLAAAAGVGALASIAGAPLVGLAAAGAALVAGSGVALAATRDRLGSLAPSDTLEDLGSALAEAMSGVGLIDDGLGAAAVRVLPQPDGYYRCLLEGASEDDARRFAVALEQLLEPLWDPSWLIPRRVDAAPVSLAGTVRLLAERSLGRRGPNAEVWHPVPDLLARRRDRVAALERAWSRWVSPGTRALPISDARAQVVLALRAGDDPFRTETQLRTLWT